MKLKKCLLTSLSLGLSAITIGAVVSSCASPAAEATDPNPASANSISTNPGDPLTQEQQDYQQKLAAEIKVQFDANASLDYSIPADKEKIDSQITKYENEINKGDLGEISTKVISLFNSIGTSVPSSDKEFLDELINAYSIFYDNFKQKNLIPTEASIDEYYKTNPSPSGINNWKVLAGSIAIFYTDPYDIILLSQCYFKTNKSSAELNTDTDKLIWDFIYQSIPTKDIYSSNDSSYQVFLYYQLLINQLNSIRIPMN